MTGTTGRAYDADHEAFREVVRDLLAKEVVPHFAEWESAGLVPKEIFARLGELGIPGMQVPEEYGGGGATSFRFSAVLTEEVVRAGVHLGGLGVHMNVVLPYLLRYATEEQRRRWLPGIARGELMTAIAMTEPGTGSDLAGMTTRARRAGDRFVLDGAKTFITGGINCDLVLVVARTGNSENRRQGLSLLVVEDGMPGFTRGLKLDKLGLHTQDTAELFFDGVEVPEDNLLGEEGQAFTYLTGNLPQERLAIALGAVAAAETALDTTVGYVKEREVFGSSLAGFQNTRFELAACGAEVMAGRAMLDRSLVDHDRAELSAADAAALKLFCTELQGRVLDRCLQLFGGYGYIRDYPIARLYADARVSRIYGGTSEVMKTIIAKSLGL
ncbi:Butyryl-CoA dehydrogenase [Pseudonocardia sp. Ae168_Ps1]|uniref:acyl-CoA dehydrogenase family protein n=1 Tax=unclassified Pseudonocardia TaxID=2619320 RepID=UPI00094B5741|nr:MULTISPECIES: acyl-CoA dehydrogenase family protein [unclassified Pseudonocardia]OLL76832.1 Butyryl-CoA dehydrogenase [Pseudonocardia sp. Ae150A_Ps1]OLL82846.1 Butyryl-CoA dehydrogenase [Pseudonocardia sp. Ae168_Ps1]OLL83042.1 Butyryl-CoA dehydrogenase [Pseudonocardia sp. Ae263_Ps1]OLL90919.1 Butyryl-CoA dehydrogenase [Pseudonocardia sp. Ae356_Ps1]